MYKTFIPDKQRIVLCSRSTTAYGPHLRSWGGRPLLDISKLTPHFPFSTLYLPHNLSKTHATFPFFYSVPTHATFPFFYSVHHLGKTHANFPFFLLCTYLPHHLSKTQKRHFPLFLLCTWPTIVTSALAGTEVVSSLRSSTTSVVSAPLFPFFLQCMRGTTYMPYSLHFTRVAELGKTYSVVSLRSTTITNNATSQKSPRATGRAGRNWTRPSAG